MRIVLSHAAGARVLGALANALEGGTIRLYDLDAPADADAAIVVQRHLATLQFTNPRMSEGQLRADVSDALALANGKAAWARLYDGAGVAIIDCDVGDEHSGAAIAMNTTAIRKGGPVVIRSFALGMRA
jgi:hypothetical protein